MDITLTWLQQTYHTLSFGNQHPTRIVVSPLRLEEIREKVYLPVRLGVMNEHPEFKIGSPLRFMNSFIDSSKFIPDDVVSFVNEKCPGDPRFNRIYAVRNKLQVTSEEWQEVLMIP